MAVDLSAHVSLGAFRDPQVSPAARRLAADVDSAQVARAITDEIMREVWPASEDPSFRDAVYRSTLGNIETIFAILSGALDEDAEPAAAIEFAEETAQLGIPLGEIDKAYRIGVAALWNMWFDAVRDYGGEASMDELVSGPTLMFHAYIDRILDAVALRHEEIRGQTCRTLRDTRRRALLALLDDGEGDAEILSRTLDYALADTHIAVLVEALEPDVVALRDALDARDTLVLQHGPRSWVIWFGRPSGYDAMALARLRRVLNASGLTAAVGEPAAGVAGLCRGHREVLEAARVQHALGDRVLWARDVRLETLLLGDERRAREFVADELGRLGEGSERLRETLLAWLATGSHVNAAATLGVHENTVRNRIRAAEELLGTPLMGRRTELQVALRLERVLTGPPAPGGRTLREAVAC